jgi:ABC-type amino acid transport substrate-binding protein
MASIPSPGQQPQDDLEAYVGLTSTEAEERAKARGWTKVRALPPGAIITMEYQEGRLNFTVTDSTVTRCWSG